MFFQINVTPPHRKPAKANKGDGGEPEDEEKHFTLVLAPFQPQTRIKLNSTIDNTVRCTLTIRNPSGKSLNVSVNKMPPRERCIKVSEREMRIPAEDCAEIEISWTPWENGSWRDTLQLTDSRRVKYDVALVTTCQGTKKLGATKSRVLKAVSSNQFSCVRPISPPRTREAKENIRANNSVQSSIPSKRQRLTVHENKENRREIDWSSAILEEIGEEKYWSKNLDHCSTKMPTVPNLRRETYTSTTLTVTHQEIHEFSGIMDSTSYNLTPIKPQGKQAIQEHERLRVVDERESDFSCQEIGIVTPEMMKFSDLRRETYVASKSTRKTFGSLEAEQAEEEENFEDSLSPQPDDPRVDLPDEDQAQNPSEFSAYLNDVNFKTPIVPRAARTAFLPLGCSSGKRGKAMNEEFLVLPQIAINNTFELNNSNPRENFQANSTYELSSSPKAPDHLDCLQPERLPCSFDRSPILASHADEKSSRFVPTKATFWGMPSSRNETENYRRSTISGSSLNRRNFDDATAKQVLEADLWVHSEQPHSISVHAAKSSHERLDRITEEEFVPDSQHQYLMNRTNTSPSMETENADKTYRLEISPPHKTQKKKVTSLCERKLSMRRVSPTKSAKIRREKSHHELSSGIRKTVQMNSSLKGRGKIAIPGVRIANLSLSGLPKRSKEAAKVSKKISEPKEVSVKLHDPNDFMTWYCNPDPFSAAMTQDPFLASTLYYDEEWIHYQEMKFKKWLNALLTPPEHLNTDVDTLAVDVGKVWLSCRSRDDVALAESREAVSARYHTNTRLNTLRKGAGAMFRSETVKAALTKAAICVERGILTVRQDRDMHRDIGLQKEILELFLSYNPLWLRIGLETVYGETIPLSSNNDLVGLTRFIITRFFSDPFIVKTHSHGTASNFKLPTFTLQMNKFMVKKFLLIVFFLDHAKRNKLIGHDPCLFHKRATHKDSRSILLTFSRELLSGVGDLTKLLRTHGYVVEHKQSYLDEYDYAVKEVSADLRDGVRLCRVMELISGDKELTRRCRVPAISRLQKVHNVDVALGALKRCGYDLAGDIDAKSVADGCREKTLSLLWQIIHKFQAPRFDKAAKTVQKWWRSRLWYIRVRNYLKNRRYEAAARIQRAWRCYKSRRCLEELRSEMVRLEIRRNEAARVLQNHWRRRMDVMRVKKRAVLTIESHWKARILMRQERRRYLARIEAGKKIQVWWRWRILGKRDFEKYREVRKASIALQSRWRAQRSMQIDRRLYVEKIAAARTIQCWWRRYIRLKRDRLNFLLERNAARVIADWWIACKMMIVARKQFLEKRNRAITIQREWRRYRATRDDASRLKNISQSCRKIQRWWRLLKIVNNYRLQRSSCITVQRWWRGVILTRSRAMAFESLRKAAIFTQKTWRMKKARGNYLRMKKSALSIECWYKNVLLARVCRRDFVQQKNAVVTIEKWWHNLEIGRRIRSDYLLYRKNVVAIQTKWRAIVLAKVTRKLFSSKKIAIARIQAWWRMIRTRRAYADLLKRHRAATVLQQRWRETRNARKIRANYMEYRASCIRIQKRYRETKLSRIIRQDFLRKRRAAIIVQANWRAFEARRAYEAQKRAAAVMQSRWRAKKRCVETRMNYIALRKATIAMQIRYRSNRSAADARKRYLELRTTVLKIQIQWRARKLANETRKRFLDYRWATIVLQSRRKMIVQQRNYCRTRNAVRTIEDKWRARQTGRKARENYESLRRAVLCVQKRYRANKMRKIAQEDYRKSRSRIIWVQRAWRLKLANRERIEASIIIQTWWKSILAMILCKQKYEAAKSAAVVVQRRFRAYKIGLETRKNYLRTVKSVVTIQRHWRTILEEKAREKWLEKCKIAVGVIENWWFRISERKRERAAKLAKFRKVTYAATIIQSFWRGHKTRMTQSPIMKQVRERSEKATKAAVATATVAVQLRESMDTLLVCDSIGQLSMCLTNIDTLTRLSSKGCVKFCELNLVDKIYSTLEQSNRSIPWMDVCLRCASILITLAKLPDTKQYVYRFEFIETLARLTTITVENHVNLFLHLATLLWLLSENQDYANAITSCPRVSWLLCNLQSTISKKKVKLPTVNMNKSRMKEQTAQLPNSKPDWGLRQRRPRIFTTVHHAITSLMKRLKLEPAT